MPQYDDVLQNDAITPAQYASMRQTNQICPEYKLMFTVLVDAIRIARTSSKKKLRDETWAWIEDKGPADGPFAFEVICDVFNLDPQTIREAARKPIKTPRRSPVYNMWGSVL
jgi:hypothetical protein